MINEIRRQVSCLAVVAALLQMGLPTQAAEHEQQNKENQGTIMLSSESTSTNFAFNLFQHVSKAAKSKSDNVMVSPFSAYAALSMVLNGAAGHTRKAMATSLGVSEDTIDLMNKNDNVQLEIANAIYSDKSTPFKQSFVSLCEKSYDAAAHSEDFGNPAVLKQINDWCNEKTHGKIAKILDKLTKDEKMVLLNAIYFKGSWKKPFDKAETMADQFKADGGLTAIKMMHMHQHFQYLKGENFQALFIPYAGERQRMYVFLPDQGIDLPAFQAHLNAANWETWRTQFHYSDINLSLPRFKVETSMLLNDTLKAMGMSEAFDSEKANFSNLIAGDWHAWISRVLQKTYMDVNEEGTEAAAVTAVTMATAAAMRAPAPPIEFRVDRPFVVALTDSESNEILFLGGIAKP